MAILNNNPLIGSGGQQGYSINNSLRFRSSATASLSRTPASATNRTTWTFSAWVKRGNLTTSQCIFEAAPNDQNVSLIYFDSNNYLYFVNIVSTTTNINLQTSQVFRDPSAWYHIVVAVDTTQATSSNRAKMYINGQQVTAFAASTYPSQNTNTSANNTVAHVIGKRAFNNDLLFDGYMADINFIDGSQKAASDFGETDTITGVWKPKAYSGTYGTNGFYLKFSDIATTSGSNAGLGKDFSGNSNYWTTNNISVTSGVTYDAMTDSPTNTSATVANYCVANPLRNHANNAITNGNLNIAFNDGTSSRTTFSTFGVTSGKWYWEMTVTSIGVTYYPSAGVNTNLSLLPSDQSGSDAAGYMYVANGQKLNNGTLASYGSSYTTNDVIGIALDMDAGTITFYKNNTSQGQAYSGITGTAVPCFIGANGACAINFGQRPFAYTPPTGFVALNTFNLPTSTIVKGNSYFDSTTWTGNGNTSRTITNAASFRPDFVWLKERDIAIDHILYDSIRGPSTSSASKALCSNTTVAEGSQNDNSTYGYLDGFTSSGFTVTRGSDGATSYTNKNNGTYVAWQWQAGQGSTSSNTSGSITSTVSVNTTAGFSIVTYTGTGSNATVGHGLGVAPKMVIVKQRSGAGQNWAVYHASLANTGGLALNLTNATITASGWWNNTSPTSSVFSLGGSTGSDWFTTNQSGSTYVAYCWAEISGYSKFGSYTGNSSTDGPFIYLGFRPKFVIFKDYSNAHSWIMVDSSRNTYNVAGDYLRAESSAVENATYSVANNTAVDFLSNGFKLRNAGVNSGENNGSSNYLYMAWAENPFKNSLAR